MFQELHVKKNPSVRIVVGFFPDNMVACHFKWSFNRLIVLDLIFSGVTTP